VDSLNHLQLVRGQYWPPKGPTRNEDFLFYIPVLCHDEASFLHQQSIRTRQILLEFYPSVQTQAICITSLRTGSLHEKVRMIRIFLLQISPEECGWECGGYHILMTYSNLYRNLIFPVPRQSFVIHPNDGWWPSTIYGKLHCGSLLWRSPVLSSRTALLCVLFDITDWVMRNGQLVETSQLVDTVGRACHWLKYWINCLLSSQPLSPGHCHWI
jgi:hypothetical protein